MAPSRLTLPMTETRASPVLFDHDVDLRVDQIVRFQLFGQERRPTSQAFCRRLPRSQAAGI